MRGDAENHFNSRMAEVTAPIIRRTLWTLLIFVAPSLVGADEVPPEWYPMAAATRVIAGFSGTGPTGLVITSNMTAKTKDGVYVFRRLPDNP